MKKKLDSRIRTLITNGVKTRQRSFFVVVGDKGRDQVVNLHYILSKTAVRARPSVLWCYKKDLGFSSHRQKRMKHIKKMMARGLLDPNEDDPFELFISSTDIRYCYYKDTQKILGNTYGMCVLQDFEAMTPNLLARTIETVEGGGIVMVLLKTMDSLKQFYTLSMDVHARFRTEGRQDVVGRFNERFILSLSSCANCLVVDDELSVLPISEKSRKIMPVHKSTDEMGEDKELREVKDSLKDEQPVGALVDLARTVDQARAILTFVEAISEKTLRTTVSLTAARGRGKSAALGTAMAGAVAYGYANIFVTSPSPENLKTLFEFVFKGFDALGYEEHVDYELVQSSNPAFNKAIVRVNVFRQHRQTIQYIQPEDAAHLGQAELLVIDEAAAIPLPQVRKLLGKYLVFMSSTINGYEGTGRSLSLKLMKKIREDSVTGQHAAGAGRSLHEVTLDEPIRYGRGDAVEKWLNDLLCLDVSDIKWNSSGGCPHPDKCDLYFVDRDTLFSYHKASEAFLQRMMSLYVASHYKNTPNDLQMMSDAPGHQLFVLLGPVDPSSGGLPDILVVVQVCLEGDISKQSVRNSLGRGKRAAGDLIPWTVSQQFQDAEFAGLSGARVVRIATHPQYSRMGYASKALDMLAEYYQGNIVSTLGSDDEDEEDTEAGGEGVDLHGELLAPRRRASPLLRALGERRPERLHYIGVSYGVTEHLYKFWKKGGYTPVYLRQTANDITGEYTCIMLRPLACGDLVTSVPEGWVDTYNEDFKRRFIALLGYSFSHFAPSLVLNILSPPRLGEDGSKDAFDEISKSELEQRLTMHDMKRLEGYAAHLIDHHVITDLVPTITELYFKRRIPVNLAASHIAILAAVGLQHRSITDTAEALSLPASQVLALFTKTMLKISKFFRALVEAEEEKGLAPITDSAAGLNPLQQTLEEDLAEGGQETRKKLKKKHDALLRDDEMASFVIGEEVDFDSAVGKARGGALSAGTVSVASTRKKRKRDGDDDDDAAPGDVDPRSSKKRKKSQKGRGGGRGRGRGRGGGKRK